MQSNHDQQQGASAMEARVGGQGLEAARPHMAHMSSNEPDTVLPFSLTEMLTYYQVASGQMVHSVTDHRHRSMWYGSNEGVSLYDAHADGPMQHLSLHDGLCGDTVRDIPEDQQGRICLAMQLAGVHRLLTATAYRHISLNEDRQTDKPASTYAATFASSTEKRKNYTT